MQFDSLEYACLLAMAVIAYAGLGARGRYVLLLAASFVFYAFWNVPLVSLILLSASVDFVAGRVMTRTDKARSKRIALGASLVVNLGLLGYFKYANFFVGNVVALLGDGDGGQIVEVLLPPGISFYTFQTLSYTIDVYRGKQAPARSFPRFLLYVCFFPQLIAGPIERAGRLLSEIETKLRLRFDASNIGPGLQQIAWGLFKKMVIADHCAAVADRYFTDPSGHAEWAAIVGTYAFTLQIYCDFSAYSEIARGSARLFGIRLMQNFAQPYLSRNVRDFWRRWHISLSEWFRDYVYLPLGGNRHGRRRMLLNLAVTMLLSGLWHGAAWNFVLWGLYHGVLLVLHGALAKVVSARPPLARLAALSPVPAWLITLHAVVAGWILFRVESLGAVPLILGQVADSIALRAAPSSQQVLFLLGVAVFMLLSFAEQRFGVIERLAKPANGWPWAVCCLVLTFLFAAENRSMFIYFQF